MTSKLVNWVNSWFLYQGEDPYPAKDRLWVYVALVDLIACGKSSRADLLTVHRYFTYLLRGWNADTAMVRRSAYERPDSIKENIFFSDDFDSVIKQLLNFETRPTPSQCFRLFGIYSRAIRNAGTAKHTDYEEEQRTLMGISLWLLSRTMHPSIPENEMLVRECLSLYHRSRSIGISSSLSVEYTNDQILEVSRWLSGNIETMMLTEMSLPVVVENTGYLTWFSALLKASRMIKSSEEIAQDLKDETLAIVDKQVGDMHKFLDTRPMRAPESLRKKNRMLNVFGIHPRKKPSDN